MKDITFWHRVKLKDGTYTPGCVQHGPDGGDWPTTRFGLPEDLTGKTVIDIGAWDGFFSFEAEKRGAASVTATNLSGGCLWGSDGFEFLHKHLESKVKLEVLDIQDIINPKVQYDVVLLFGVLYHIKNPILALENCFKFTAPHGICLVETAVTSLEVDKAILEYDPGCHNDSTNCYYPNKAWMEAAAKQAGFNSCVELAKVSNRRTYRLEKL